MCPQQWVRRYRLYPQAGRSAALLMLPMDCVMASPTAALQQRSPVRFQFDGPAGDEVSVTAAPTCTRSDIAEWGLEDPDGFRVTLRTPACKDTLRRRSPRTA